MQAETEMDGQQPMRDPSAGSTARRFLNQLAVEAKVDVEQPMANPISGWCQGGYSPWAWLCFFDMCVYLSFGGLWELPDFRKTI